ncbi:MAG: hypothetical protein HOM11_03675 [Methylococcales bacterium]|jgi:hypothetical protein|nr:hypothetical protein [Methylococcales bacterium]MBT7443755.1 hypothetical protein [Methylococcales bacterium]
MMNRLIGVVLCSVSMGVFAEPVLQLDIDGGNYIEDGDINFIDVLEEGVLTRENAFTVQAIHTSTVVPLSCLY